ncbi:MAG: hypothetical protein CM15mP22_8350 [Gammaproteobacteria bacterium]|nr:MAG: hypothetical protein CM15mP22_8350 [Gammaproteobacteria bacterium]
MTVKVLSPKKIKLPQNPFPNIILSNCVAIELFSKSCNGENSCISFGAITTPAACLPILLAHPLSFGDKSKTSALLHSLF